jgi:hypothetical protein
MLTENYGNGSANFARPEFCTVFDLALYELKLAFVGLNEKVQPVVKLHVAPHQCIY